MESCDLIGPKHSLWMYFIVPKSEKVALLIYVSLPGGTIF